VFEQGGPSGNIPVIDLFSSSDEEDFFTGTSRDVVFARQLFRDPNRDLHGPPGDDKVIALNDSDEEEEVCEEIVADADAVPSAAMKSLTPAASTADVDEDLGKIQDNNSDDLAPVRTRARIVVAETKLAHLRLPCQEWRLW
jgi:hypothetical protein